MDAEPLRLAWLEASRPFTADQNRGIATGPDLVFTPGAGRVGVTAVHGVVHQRRGHVRQAEVNTAALAVVANQVIGASTLVVAKTLLIEDANRNAEHPARVAALAHGLWGTDRVAIDVHGQTDRPVDLVLSWGGIDFEASPGEALARRLATGFAAAGFPIDLGGRTTGFAAAGPTMTRAAAESGTAAVQMEISRRCRTFAQGSDRGRVAAFIATFLTLIATEDQTATSLIDE